MTDHERLLAMLAERSARRGHFTLASGRESTLYIDARQTTMSPDGLALVGPLGLAALESSGWRVDAVGGLTLGADPISYAVAYASALAGRPLRAFTVRKEAKAHGTGQLVEGPLRPGSRVVIVDDVATTGGSSLQAVAAVESLGCRVARVVVVLDRLEGAAEAFAAHGLDFRALVTIRDLGVEPLPPLGR
jgi:orotate phosphoribosyltransferase